MQQEETPTRLRGYLLIVARCAWSMLVVCALSLFASSLPLYYTHLLRVCTSEDNPLCTLHGTLSSTGMQALHSLAIAPAAYAGYTVALSVAAACLWCGIGLWIFWRRSDDWMALFVSAFLITYSTNLTAGPPSVLAEISPAWGIVAACMSLWAVSALGLFFCLFPDGRLVPRWMGWIAAGYILLQIITFFPPFKSFFSAGIQSLWLTNLIFVGILGVLISAQLNRYRQSKNPVLRQQTKWVVFGSTAAIVGVLAADIPYLFTHSLAQTGVLELSLNSVFYLVTLPIPLSIGIAMARYRLYDIDVLINRTLIYGTLTCLLTLLYFGLVVTLQIIFRPFTDGSQLIIVLSTLAIAALFQPLRTFVQQLINRRFYRSSYDAGRILTAFGLATRREIDLPLLREQLITILKQTLQPMYITLQYADIYAKDQAGKPDPFRGYFLHHPDASEPEQQTLPASPLLFQKPITLVVPLLSQGDFIGWLGLGARSSGQGYSIDDRRLLNTLAAQIAPAIQVAQLVRERETTALERERMEQELRVAQRIQHSLLPDEIPALPRWQIATYYQPAREVGGDFYDFFPFADGRIGLVVGDVSGEGVPAALVMATTHSILHAIVKADVAPGAVLDQANNTLQPDIPSGMFVTCFYAILDPQSGLLHYANAGHDLPYRHAPGNVVELQARGMPLGLMPNMEYEEQQMQLLPGEGVVFYSDGLVEAHNQAREMFGFPRVIQLLGEQTADTDLIQFLRERLQTFTGPNWEQEDDITLVTLHRTL